VRNRGTVECAGAETAPGARRYRSRWKRSRTASPRAAASAIKQGCGLRIEALFDQIGASAKMAYPIHPHMLRHGCGFALAKAGHDTRALQAWLGHKNIQHTVRYTELAPDRFRDFWR
jgi:integrase